MLRRFVRQFVWTLVLAVVAVQRSDAAEVRLTGRVTDKTNAPVAGAKVTATIADQHFDVESDPTGAFALVLPALGDYDVTVDRQGFYLHQIKSLALSEAPLELHVALESVHELRSSVDVTASQGTFDMDQSGTQNTLSSRTLFDVPFPNQNSLRNGLRMLPGVVQDSRGGIHVNGSAEEQVHHNFEGFQLNDPLTGRLDARMSLEAVESVEVSPGQPGPEFGRGVGGTLSIHARKGDDQFRFSATNVFPGFDTQRGTTVGNWTPRGNMSGPWWRQKAWFFNTLELQYVNTLVPELPGGQNRARSYRANDLLHNQINLTPSNVLTVGVLFNYWFAPRNGLTSLDPRETTIDRRSRQWFGYVKEQKSFSRGALIEAGYAASRTFNRDVPQGDAPYIVTPEGRRGNYFANARREASRDQLILNAFLPLWTWKGTHQFKVGGDFLKLGYNQAVHRTSIQFASLDFVPLQEVSFYGSGTLHRGNQEGSAYVQDSWRVRRSLLLDLGLRVERNQMLGNSNLSPRLGFAWSPPGREGTRITGGFARVFDNTSLLTFTRPADQFSVITDFDASGPIGPPELSLYRMPRTHLLSPHATTWNLGLEQHLPNRMLGRVQWLRRTGGAGFNYVNSLAEPQHAVGILNFEGDPNPLFKAIYFLTNQRRDSYNSVEFSVRQPLASQHEWMASYTRSAAHSNGVFDRSIDEVQTVGNNVGPLPWDAPNRFLSWGFVPTFLKDWSVAYLLEWRSGFPFSVQDARGYVPGSIDDHRFPAFFEADVSVERRMTWHGYRIGLRGGFLNITNHQNPNVVNNVIGSPFFLHVYGGQRRALNFRIRFLGKA